LTIANLCTILLNVSPKTLKNYVNRLSNHRNRNRFHFRIFNRPHLTNRKKMKKATKVLAQIIYFIIAFSPIFFLGYLLGLQLIK
jgi:hypothetical protein